MATKVKLYDKPGANGRRILFLDIYPAIINPKTGRKTRRDFIGYYIHSKPKTALERNHNKDTLKIAEAIRQQRENELNKPEIYTQYEKEQLRIQELGQNCFVEYFRKLTEKRSGSNYDAWLTISTYLEDFSNGNLRFADLTERKIEDFKEYLLNINSKKSNQNKLSRNTAASYFLKIKAALKQAYKDGFLQSDLNSKIKPIKQEETRRNYLTLDELNKLAHTPCNNEILKKAALFSSLTGLRFSDIRNLAWKNVVYTEDDGYSLHFRQQKTKNEEYHPISDQAVSLMGEIGTPDSKIFEGLKYSAYQNRNLYQWIGAAGITKKITFHCFRHSYATILQLLSNNIYTVSNMLGHRDIKTTQIYAKVVNEAKRKAANSIQLDL